MLRVMKDFNTPTRRFREGDQIRVADLLDDVLGLAVRLTRGFVSDGNPGVHEKGGAKTTPRLGRDPKAPAKEDGEEAA